MPPSSFLHYRIERPLGAGAMGQVFLARDEILHRSVALKFLPEAEARDPALGERLVREARTLATLSHPHIAAVHALESDGERSCLVMEYVEGETLADRIGRGPLGVPETIALGLAMAEALAHAHERGAIHRDVKPGNILLARDGSPKLADFGIARLEGISTLTTSGALPGTIPYMSPEQASGGRADARSDLFALGVVLYESLTGTHPFGRERLEAVVYAILHESPEPPTARRTGIPLDLERVILKCLEKDPSLRYQGAAEIAADLRRLERAAPPSPAPGRPGKGRRSPVLVAAAATLAIGLVAWGVATVIGRRSAKADSRTVLVMPFEVRGQTEGVDYLGRAFAEAIAVNLAQVPALRVLPVPEAGEAGGGGTQQRARAALKLNARNLLSGALTRESRQLTANLSLTDAVENRIRWGTQGATTSGSLPMLAAFLAGQVATQLGVAPKPGYDSPYYMTGHPPLNAAPEFAEALGALRRQQPERALDATRRLIAQFPGEADAHILRACAAVGGAFKHAAGSPERRVLEASLLDLDRVDPAGPWAGTIRAIFLDLDHHPAEAIDGFSRVLARDDLTPAARGLVLGWRAWPHINRRDLDAALADLEEAVRLDPTNDNSLSILGVALGAAARHAEAAERHERAVALNPYHCTYHSRLAKSLIRIGRWEEAAPHLERECSEQPIGNCAAMHAVQAVVLQRAGRASEVAGVLARAAAQPETPFADYVLACHRLLRNEPAVALRLLGRAVDLGYEDRAMADDPNLRALAEDPGFRALASGLKSRLESKPIGLPR